MTVDLAFTEYGSGRPLVLLHAFPFSSALFGPLVGALEQALAPTGHPVRVLTPDLRGFGSSPLGSDAPSLDRMADDVAGWMASMGLASALVGGVSMGGYVTMAMMRRHPDLLEGVLLLDTKAGADSDEARAGRLAQADAVLADGPQALSAMPPALLGHTSLEERPSVVAQVASWLATVEPAAVAWAQRAMAQRPDSTPTLVDYGGPAAVLVGAEDTLSPGPEADAMAHALGTDAPTVIPGAGHLAVLEDPGAVAVALRAVLPRLAVLG